MASLVRTIRRRMLREDEWYLKLYGKSRKAAMIRKGGNKTGKWGR